MEKKLTSLHHSGLKSQLLEKAIAFAASLFIITLLPYIHLGLFYYIWSPDKPVVDRDKCSCDCFDTVFRGRYEWPPSTYKHLYFNATSNTLKIWLVVVLGVLALYECLHYICVLVWNHRLRTSMFVLFLSSLYPHYYGWWGLFNYLNEDYYAQWRHQLFFSITEAISTCIVVHLCNQDNRVKPWKLLVILDVNLMHVIVSGLDQFIDNVIYGQGQQFEATRDLGLMAPDIFHVLVAYFELAALAEKEDCSIFRLFYREEITGSVVLIILFSVFGKNI